MSCNILYCIGYYLLIGLARLVLYIVQTENGYPLFSVLESVWSLASRASIQSLHFGKTPMVPPIGVLAFYCLSCRVSL